MKQWTVGKKQERSLYNIYYYGAVSFCATLEWSLCTIIVASTHCVIITSFVQHFHLHYMPPLKQVCMPLPNMIGHITDAHIMPANARSVPQSPIHAVTNPVTNSLSHSVTHLVTNSVTNSVTHSVTHPVTNSVTNSVTHSVTHPVTNSVSHSLSHSLLFSQSPTKLSTASHPCMQSSGYNFGLC